jgi:tetratricopeptide (TPR) repeat protein
LGDDSVSQSRPIGAAQDEDASVRHLLELGYVDPLDSAAEAIARRRELKSKLDQAVELKREGRSQEAAALLVQISADDPEWVAPHLLLAEIHYSAGEWDAVEARLEWLTHHGVDEPRSALVAAGTALAHREMQRALEQAEFACCADATLRSSNTVLGSILLRLGRLDDAEDAFRRAVEQDPNDAHARDGLAAVYLIHREYDDAADWALRALEQDMRLFSAHYHLGLALAGLDRPHDAIAALETAARVDSRRTAPFYWMSRIASDKLGDEPRSAEYRKRAKTVIRQRRGRP